MIEKLYKYSLTDKDLFENIVDDENLRLNHVVIESGKFFPRHKTDAHVYIIILKGQLSIEIGEQEEKRFGKGDVINIPFGVDSKLGNDTDTITEAFVVKIDPDK
ncbi:cupin domain-containing protein [Wukongibacter baidiensis]|uniref:cupin domain-containing protein n=1 Tax=Wukongibacter baidiensis TaxID=1723361 RepID=UPI003D7F7CA9